MMSSWLKLSQKTAIVTGSSSGIGAAVAKELLAHGANVIGVDINTDEAQIRCDVADEAQVKAVFSELFTNNKSDQQQPPSILINCAGITRDGWIGKMSLDQWQKVQDVNMTGTFLMCREFLRQQESSSAAGGSIINVSSVVALQGNLGQVNYAASKGGVLSFTKALAKEVAFRNIRVNSVVPGFIDTEMARAVPEEVREHIIPKIAVQKFGDPQDVANLVCFLASCERSGYITGESIECSGLISL